MIECTAINVEVDGVELLAKVTREELVDCVDRVGWSEDFVVNTLDDIDDADLLTEIDMRGLTIDDSIDGIPEDEVADMLHEIFLLQLSGHDIQPNLNKLYREFLGREL